MNMRACLLHCPPSSFTDAFLISPIPSVNKVPVSLCRTDGFEVLGFIAVRNPSVYSRIGRKDICVRTINPVLYSNNGRIVLFVRKEPDIMCLSYSNFHPIADDCCKATWSQTESPLAFHGKDNWECTFEIIRTKDSTVMVIPRDWS